MALSLVRPTPKWDDGNAERHCYKHMKCFQRLLGVDGREVTVKEFKERAQSAIDHSWAEFLANKLNNGKAAYFVDDALVEAIVTLNGQTFRTCFHQHCDQPKQCESLIQAPAGDRRIRFIRYLNFGEQGGVYTEVKRIRGV